MLRSNLRYLLSVILQAGKHTGEIKKIPKIKIEFNSLWSMTETEKVALDLQKAQVESAKAQTAAAYVQMQAIDPGEVRKKLADEGEFDVETLLDDFSEEELEENDPKNQQQEGGDPMAAMMGGGGGGENPLAGMMGGGEQPQAPEQPKEQSPAPKHESQKPPKEEEELKEQLTKKTRGNSPDAAP